VSIVLFRKPNSLKSYFSSLREVGNLLWSDGLNVIIIVAGLDKSIKSFDLPLR
jgi:hypothetical protein